VPVTGEKLVAVPALDLDVAIVHAQEADRDGNVQLLGIPGVQKEAVLGARRSLVTVERIVDALEPRPGGLVIPGWAIDAVAEAPGGSLPSYSLGITESDNDFYKFWDKLSRDRDEFRAWMEEQCRDPDRRRGPPAARRRFGLHRRRPALDRGDPRPRALQPRPRARLRVGDDRRQAAPHPALDRRRRTCRDGRCRRLGAGDVQTRLPGAGGAPEIALGCPEVIVVAPHDTRTFVAELDFLTTVAAPSAVITDLGVLEPDAESKELTLTRLHPGATVDAVRGATGWDLAVADAPTTTKEPTADELAALRELIAR